MASPSALTIQPLTTPTLRLASPTSPVQAVTPSLPVSPARLTPLASTTTSFGAPVEATPAVIPVTPSPRLTARQTARSTPLQLTLTSPVLTPVVTAPVLSPMPAARPNPTEDELNALGVKPLEVVTIQSDGAMSTYIKALTKHGYKVLIDVDQPGASTVGYANVRLQKVIPQKALELPKAYHDTCNSCREHNACGVAFERDGSMCRLTPQTDDNKMVVVKEELFANLGDAGDPYGIFKGDAAPYPIVKLSTLRANPAAVHCAIEKMTHEIVAALMKADLAEIAALKVRANAFAAAVAKYEASLYHEIDHLRTTSRKLKAFDEQCDRIKMCDLSAEAMAKHMERRSQIWTNLTHRHLMWGHLLHNADGVARLNHPVQMLHTDLEAHQAILNAKCADMDKIIDIKYVS